MDSFVTYRKADVRYPLTRTPTRETPNETTREFRVDPLVDVTEGHLDGHVAELSQLIRVGIRYQVDGDDADQTLQYYAGSDSARITEALLRPNVATRWTVSDIEHIQVFAQSVSKPFRAEIDGVWIMEMIFRVDYLLEA